LARRKDEDNYRWLSTLNAVAMQRYRERDIEGLREILGTYTKLLEQHDEDPQLSTLETVTAQCILQLAESYLDVLDFDSCLELCADVKDIADCKAERYIASGRKPRPDSMVWCRLVSILADAKWKGRRDYKDQVCTLDEMARIYERAEINVRAGLAQFLRSEKTSRSQLRLLSLCGMQLVRAFMRWQPQEVVRLKTLVTELHGSILRDPEHHFYWCLRLCALYISGCTSRQKYVECYSEARAAYVNKLNPQSDLRAYDASCSNELEYLLSTASYQLKLIEFEPSQTTLDRSAPH
jgi:hypothetical protein